MRSIAVKFSAKFGLIVFNGSKICWDSTFYTVSHSIGGHSVESSEETTAEFGFRMSHTSRIQIGTRNRIRFKFYSSLAPHWRGIFLLLLQSLDRFQTKYHSSTTACQNVLSAARSTFSPLLTYCYFNLLSLERCLKKRSLVTLVLSKF